MEPTKDEQLLKELTTLLNKYSAENGSNTPDFILAQYLLGCLRVWNDHVQWRERWYGRNPNEFPALTNSKPNPSDISKLNPSDE